MAKSAVLKITLTTYKDNGDLLAEEIKSSEGESGIITIEYDKLTRKDNSVSSGTPITIDLSEIPVMKGFILFNKGGATIDYKMSGAASSGSVSGGGTITIFAATIDEIIISTTDSNPVDFQYFLIG